jgi:uncharacterized protein (UPF0335 family)
MTTTRQERATPGETVMTLSVPDGKGGTIETGPFTADDFNQAMDQVRGRAPMKETDGDRDVKEKAYRVPAGELRSFIERAERLDAEKAGIAEQSKEVFAEAKSRGYDVKIIRMIIARRKRDKDDIAEEEAVLELYLEALGMS